MNELRESAIVPTIGEPTRPPQQEEVPQQPKYDNFYTPRNHDFYSKFQYADLNTRERRIRLLRIHPPVPADNASAMVQCDFLDNISMKDMAGKYTTISYCAGDPKKTEVILVNGFEFNAFANLGHALRQARYFWKDKFEEQELLLWADQVCIDQSNSLERTHQVEMMGDIYASAEQVLICLSTEGDPTGGIEWIHDLRNDPTLSNGSIYTKEVQECIINGNVDNSILNHDQFVFYSKWTEMDYQLQFDTFQKIILRSAWWSRVWVQQEFIRSRQAFFIAAFEAIRWKAIVEVMELYWRITIHSINKRAAEICSNSNSNIWTASDIQASAFTQGPFRDSYVGIRANELLKLKLRIESKAGQFPDMLDHLNRAYLYESSDPRDMIYARLGISERCKNIVPDYSPEVSFQDVLTRWVVSVISEDNSLAIIEWGYLTRHSKMVSALPSWVPDWRFPSGRSMDKDAICLLILMSSISFAPDCNRRKNCILQVKGVFYDLLEPNIGELPKGQTNFKQYTTAKGKQELAVGRPEVGDQAWLIHGYNNILLFRPTGVYFELVGEILGENELLLPNVPALLEGLASMVEADDPLVQTVKIC